MPTSVAVVRRSHCTPDASRMRLRSSARWRGPPVGEVPMNGDGRSRTAAGASSTRPGSASGRACSPVPLRSEPGNSSSSTEIDSSSARAYSVDTDGWARPVSIWDTRLAETWARSASSRRLNPRAVRSARNRCPMGG